MSNFFSKALSVIEGLAGDATKVSTAAAAIGTAAQAVSTGDGQALVEYVKTAVINGETALLTAHQIAALTPAENELLDEAAETASQLVLAVASRTLLGEVPAPSAAAQTPTTPAEVSVPTTPVTGS